MEINGETSSLHSHEQKNKNKGSNMDSFVRNSVLCVCVSVAEKLYGQILQPNC